MLSGVELFEVLGFGFTVPYSAVYCCHLLSLFITCKLSSYIKKQTDDKRAMLHSVSVLRAEEESLDTCVCV